LKFFQFKSSLRRQIIISSLICLILPFAIALYLSSNLTRDLVEKQAVTNAQESLKSIKNQLMDQMEGMFSVVNQIELLDPQTTSYLKSADYRNTALDYSYVTDKLNSLTHDKTGVYATILTPDKRFFSNYLLSTNFNPVHLMNTPWFKDLDQLVAFQNLWLGLHPNYLDVEKEQYPYMITFARTLRTSASHKPYAYMIMSTTERRVRDLFASYNEQKVLLLDRNGVVISGDRELGQRFEPFTSLSDSGMKSGEHSLTKVDGVSHLIVTEKLPFDDWTLVSLIPYSHVSDSITNIYRSNFIWQIGFIALFVIILVGMLRRFTNPLMRLSKVVSNIEAGNLSIRSEVRGSNEIGKLGKSIDRMLDRIEEMVQQINREQKQARKAELSMLQAQISPHFLFNILNSIRMRVMLKGDRDNADLISSLSFLLRMTIQKQDEKISLREEVKIAKQYMDLMKATLKEPFMDQIVLSVGSEEEPVPRFILQPIIENALIHGLPSGSGRLSLESVVTHDLLILYIRDNGKGMDEETRRNLEEKLERSKAAEPTETSGGMSGIGLVNVYNRLHMIYGSACSMRIESQPDEGTTVIVTIPRTKEDSYAEGHFGG
jgi:two-component system, sensor histidine kinase YesM